jgi:hypothetical protein
MAFCCALRLNGPMAKGPALPTAITIRRGFGIHLALPAGWRSGYVGTKVECLAPGNAAYLRIQDAKTTWTLPAIAKSFADGELKDLKKKDPHATVTVTNERVDVGLAAKVTMRYRGLWVGRLVEITRDVYFLKHGNHAYEFDFGAPHSTATDKALFSAVINSVRFLGSTGA